jgi:ElaB/YqjD/DUF883 family membrane-anchored ribosome-binding protein
MNATSERPGANRDPEHLERTADRIRADLDATLDALERKLSPSQLLDRSIEYLREHGGEMAYAVGDSVRRNPVPILLTVAGIGWLIASAVRKRATIDVTPAAAADLDDVDDLEDLEDVDDLDDEMPEDSSYRERYSSPRSRFRDGMAAARARTRRAQYRAVSALEERPLLFGGLAVAVGALLGALIPSTEYEDKVVGQMRDRAVERAKQMGERQYQNLRSRFENPDLEVSGQAH